MDAKLSNCAGRPVIISNKEKEAEESCWANLPSDLQGQLLAFLPALKLVELQRVCRAWRLMLCSPFFTERWQSLRISHGLDADVLHVWMMRRHEGLLLVYIPMLRKAAPLTSFATAFPPMSFPKGPNLDWRYWSYSRDDFASPEARLRLLGGTRHFMFFERENSGTLHVYNTITGHTDCLKNPYEFESYRARKSYRLLPTSVTMSTKDCAHDHFRIIIDMHVMRRRSSTLLKQYPNASFVWGRSKVLRELRVYDSKTDCWFSFPYCSATHGELGDSSAVSYADFLEFYTGRNMLYVWHLQKWSKFQVSFAEKTLASDARTGKEEVYRWDANTFKVVKCNGHVFLASPMVEKGRNIMVRGFFVWQLMTKEAELSSLLLRPPPPSSSSSSSSASSPCTWAWLEVSRTPTQLLANLSRDKCFHPSFSTDGYCICMSSSREPVVYDVLNGSWFCLTQKMQALCTMSIRSSMIHGQVEAVRENNSKECEDECNCLASFDRGSY